MARRTLEAMVGAVQRRLGGYTVGLGEIVEALASANRDLHAKWDWPWTYAETTIDIPPNYNVGSVTFNANTALVTGAGTTWDTTWTNRRIQTGPASIAYRVASFTSPTTLILAETPNTSQAGAGYIIFQDTFQLPADFEPGQDMNLANLQLRNRISHIPRHSLDEQSIVLVQFFTNVSVAYADAGFDPVTKRYLMKIIPPPGGVQQFRFRYRRMPIDLTTPDQYTEIPQSFDDVLEWMALTELAGVGKMPDLSRLADAKATRKLKDLRRRIAMTPIENSAANHSGGPARDGSMSQWGLTVNPQ